ncbi:ATP-binding protein [Roseovarius autotrophicus]|uniref:ATP-binding protein n=1 Tax=Roseovarius autotrophicus TaxID=2824121 RepID=UPI0019F71B87|nr:sensor histidine kinase [Roseovarius autotrophicus]MBE0453050.1 sensor histidine kinase [Roseovarius sp.]
MALAEGMKVRDMPPRNEGDLVLGDDFVAPDRVEDSEITARRARRGWLSLRGSPLTRKIVTFNLIALNILVIGILHLNGTQSSLVDQTIDGLRERASLTADVVAARLPQSAPVNLVTGDGIDVSDTLERLSVRAGTELFLFDAEGNLVGRKSGNLPRPRHVESLPDTPLTDLISRIWAVISRPFATEAAKSPEQAMTDRLRDMAATALDGGAQARIERGTSEVIVAASAPVMRAGTPVGVIALADTSGEIARLSAVERERVLEMFLIATLISVGLSLVLASTISNPLADLAAAAEIGRDRNRAKGAGGRIRIPDLTARPDEIGRLSAALRGMVGALYSRIESNEQFAADVAHEIKNPLASLRSAVGTMRIAKREDQRERLLEVIEHDVRRLDRLVSDISNASRLDSELVRETQEVFDLVTLLRNLGSYLGEEAAKKGIEFITDFPKEPVLITGLEARLAQVFVNLITNAISFCDEGDAIRIWARHRANRVLVVVEDTGPGIPPEALEKIFLRFYSERPEGDFGNNSGLGLAISKQIVEAHEGVIWAENIRPTHADATSEPLGARFVVGLPV